MLFSFALKNCILLSILDCLPDFFYFYLKSGNYCKRSNVSECLWLRFFHINDLIKTFFLVHFWKVWLPRNLSFFHSFFFLYSHKSLLPQILGIHIVFSGCYIFMFLLCFFLSDFSVPRKEQLKHN